VSPKGEGGVRSEGTLQLGRLGLAGHGVPSWSPESLLEMATSRLSVHALDYWPWNRGSLSLPEFRKLLEKFHVEVYVVNVPSQVARAGLADQETVMTRALLDAIDDAVALGAPFVQFYTGVELRPEFLTTAKMLARLLQPALEQAQQRGVTLLMENNLDQRGDDPLALNPSRRPEMVLAVMEEVNSPHLGLCYDPCNFYAVGAEGFPYAYQLLKRHIRNVHIKDCVRYSPLLHYDKARTQKLLVDSISGAHLPVPVGQGAVNWDGILRQLEADEYRGWLTLDPFATEATFTDWCVSSVEFLAKYINFSQAASRPEPARPRP
jgi:sugar phosphate isomerase/epimerase